jgi:hypothetical protein
MAVAGPGALIPSALGDVILGQIVTVQSEQTAFAGCHWYITSLTGGVITLGNIATTLDAQFGATTKPALSAQATYKGVLVRRIQPTPPSPPCWDTANQGLGGVVGDVNPRQTCGVVSKGTALAGRKYRGRLYLSFPGESDNAVNGVPAASYAASLTGFLNNLRLPVNVVSGGATAVLLPCIYHRPVPPAAFFVTNITSITLRTIWGTQRRRGSFGRPNTSPIP